MKLKGFESWIFSIPNNSKQSEQSKQLNNYILSEPISDSDNLFIPRKSEKRHKILTFKQMF